MQNDNYIAKKGRITMIGQMEITEKKQTQCDKVLRHLRDYKTLTSKEAMEEYGIYQLVSRISDLKKAGHNITSRTVTAKNRYQEDTHFSEYSLIQ